MSTPCENCGSDFRVCISCDLYNGKYIEIPDNATNGDMIKTIFPNTELHKESDYVSLTIQDGVYLEDRDGSWWFAPYQKGGKE